MKTKLFFLLLCLISLPCFAVIRYVNVNVIGGTSDGLSWPNAYNNLQTALTAAAPGDEIWMAQGTYKPVIPVNPATPTNAERAAYYTIPAGVKIYGGFVGAETLLNERNWTSYPTIISGDINNSGTNDTGDSFRLIYMENVGTQTELNGLIIENTYTHYESTYYYGVGIANIANGAISSPRVNNCIIRNHHTKGAGSILNIAVNGGDGQPVYTNCIIYNNFGRDASGGIYNRFSGDNPATIAMPVFINCTIVGNGTEDPQLGGAVFNQLYVPGGIFIPVFTNCIIWGNTVHTDTDIPAQNAIYSDPTVTPTVTYSNVQGVLVVGMGNLNQDPLFVNQAAGDLRLFCNSPSINTGNSAANTVPTDIVGSARISNTIDMGAYELAEVMYVKAGNTATIRNGLSWETAYNENELQTAINQASTATTCGVIQVWVAQGTYQPSTIDMSISYAMKNKVEIYGGFVGTETMLSARNYATNATILSGANYNYNVIFNPNNVNNTAVLDGFTITGGNANVYPPEYGHSAGGGMFNDGQNGTCSPTIRNCKFISNYALTGGAVYNSGLNGTSSPKFINCSFSNNSASAGGVMFNFTNLNGTSSPSLINCSLSKNSAQTVAGIYNNQVTGEIKPILTNCILWDNTDELYNTQLFNEGGAAPIITYCDIQGNGTDAANHNIDQNPIFVDATNNDLRLQPCSPAINVGNDAANSTLLDLGASNRKFGIIDIGAYEYQGSKVAHPTASAGTTTSVVCVGKSISLTATGGNTFSWNGPSGSGFTSTDQNPSFTASSVSLSGVYSVAVSNLNCLLSATTTVSVQVNPSPIPTPSSNSPLCTGQTLQLSSNGGGTGYSWAATGYSSTQQNPSRVSATTDMSGVYAVTLANGFGCTASASIVVQVYSAPNLIASSNSPLCEGKTLQLSAAGGSSYSWNASGFSSTQQNPSRTNATPSMNGVYTVIALNSSCTLTATATLNVQVMPSFTVSLSVAPICIVGNPLNLSVNGGGDSYAWKGPNGFKSSSATPTKAKTVAKDEGVYSVTVTGNAVCTVTSTIRVYYGVGKLTATSNSPVCKGGTIQLSATAEFGNSYSWTKQLGSTVYTGQNPTIPNAKTSDGGLYMVFAKWMNGCIGKQEVLVIVSPIPCVATRLASEEAEEMDMQINAYPNPVTNTLTVEVMLQKPSKLSLKLFNSIGKESGSWQLNDEATFHKTELNMSEFTGGVYLLQAQAGKQKVVKKVVKMMD